MDLGVFVGGAIGSGGFWASWYPLSLLALMTSLVILAFLYMWCVIFRNAALNEFVKLEMFELLTTVVIIFMIFFFAAVFANMAVSSFLPSYMLPKNPDANTNIASMNIYSATQKYFEVAGKDMAAWLELNYILNVRIDTLASVTPYSRPLGVGLVASPLAGFASPIKQLLYNMSVALSVAYIINWAQLRVFEFAIVGFLKYYLPIGILLRSFTPTRRLGGTLIAFAASFLFVFPLFQIISYGMFYNNNFGPMVTISSFITDYVNDLGPNGLQMGISNFFKNNFTGGLGGVVSGILSAMFGTVFSLNSGFFIVVMTLPISVIGIAFTIGFIAPAFNVLLFIQAAKSLSRVIGEEIDITQLTRMI